MRRVVREAALHKALESTLLLNQRAHTGGPLQATGNIRGVMQLPYTKNSNGARNRTRTSTCGSDFGVRAGPDALLRTGPDHLSGPVLTFVRTGPDKPRTGPAFLSGSVLGLSGPVLVLSGSILTNGQDRSLAMRQDRS